MNICNLLLIISTFTIVGCSSGGSHLNQSAGTKPLVDDSNNPDVIIKDPNNNSDFGVVNLTAEERQKVETILDDSSIQWRSINQFKAGFLNDLKKPINIGISDSKKAAAYNYGYSYFAENPEPNKYPLSLTSKKDLYLTNYDPEFLVKAEIALDKLQSKDVTLNGKKVGAFGFVNQKYSSYLGFKAETFSFKNGQGKTQSETSQDMVGAYVAVPTSGEKLSDLKKKGKATYRGHTIGNQNSNTSEMSLGDISLTADFDTMMIKGKVTNRNDMLLAGQEKYVDPGNVGAGEHVTNKDDVEGNQFSYLSKEQLYQKRLENKKKDINLVESRIVVKDNIISFYSGDSNGFNYKDGSKVVSIESSSYGGVFAGPNGEEVVGQIRSGDDFESTRLSFGATLKK